MQKASQSNTNRFIRLAQIVNPNDPMIPVCSATIWNWVNSGNFPKPIKLSPSVTVWRAEEIEAFINNGGVK